MVYTVTYKFTPNDPMWILDNNSVKKATCLQAVIKVVPSADTIYATEISYIALLDCNAGTLNVLDQYTYQTLDEAIAALQTQVQNTICS